MKYGMKRIIATLAIALCMVITVVAGGRNSNQQGTVWMFGFAASFNDSTVYMTDIQMVDSAWTTNKNIMLTGRDNYSYQLRDYLKKQGVNTPTCVTTFALKYKDIQKKYLKMKRRYTKGGRYDVRFVETRDFSYTPIEPINGR